MSNNPNRRLRPAELAADQESLLAIQNMPGYRPLNQEYETAKLAALVAAAMQARQAELLAQQALASARDTANAAEWAMHEAMIGAKQQVLALFGRDSNEVQAVGLKKLSKRKSPSRE